MTATTSQSTILLRHGSYYNAGYDGGTYYNSGYWGNAYAGCGRVRIADGRGGWVWGYGGC